MTRLGALVGIVSCIVACRGKPPARYYNHLERLVCPPRPERPIDESEARARDRAQSPGYYVVDFDERGRPIRIVRRLAGKERFAVQYAYLNGRVEERGSGDFYPSCSGAGASGTQ